MAHSQHVGLENRQERASEASVGHEFSGITYFRLKEVFHHGRSDSSSISGDHHRMWSSMFEDMKPASGE